MAAALGDAVGFLAFPMLGQMGHEAVPIMDALVRTTLPFAVVWLVISSLAGGYRRATIGSGTRSLRFVVLVWPLSGVLALLLRSLAFDREWAWSFVAVSLLVQGLLLVVWRFTLAHFIGQSRSKVV